jgi:hypothetical protein
MPHGGKGKHHHHAHTHHNNSESTPEEQQGAHQQQSHALSQHDNAEVPTPPASSTAEDRAAQAADLAAAAQRENEERTRDELDAQLELMSLEEAEQRQDVQRRALRAKNTPGAVAASRAAHNANKSKLKSDLKKVNISNPRLY